jgi:hypothetical protein
MKKELLMASALVSTLGATSVAQAVTATTAGSMKIGAEFESADDSTVDSNQVHDYSNFNVSLTETTDGGTTISSSFEILDEGTAAGDDDNALKLTFSDGSALELLNAGNASSTHAIGVPGASGEQGVGGTTTNNAPTGIDFAAGSTPLGIEWHSAADFLADGLKVSASFSSDNGAAKAVTARIENSFGVGATYVTSAGDTTLTIGGGYANAEVANSGTQLVADKAGFNLGVVAVTGDLTIGVGYGDGDTIATDNGAGTSRVSQIDGSVMKAGIKYVSGDITLAIGTVSGEAKDSTTAGTAGTTDDSHDETGASVSYAVASGVSAVLGYVTVDQNDEGASDASSGGSAWYVGASMSF